MKDVIDNIYGEYKDNLIKNISDDSFYKYFYNLLETGTTMCQFFNRKLVKEVDEEWVVEIEKAIPHLQYNIDKPRTFIEEDRQVVNVALARKFTSESVKHLSMHSEMIDKVRDDGSVEPNRVLNVFKEESINTYENRFIYTLLLELKTFVNKRSDVIFDNSKNEDGVKLSLDSVIDNYNEVIDFKTTMRVQTKQTTLSNDEDNINVFSRISKLQKSVNDMAASGFMMEMSKFPLVKYPVVKTNAIAKNEHYKACYDLWNFIRSYDKVGYKVEMVEQDPMISKAFENDIYNMMILNYVLVRKQMTIKDVMNIEKPARDKSLGVNFLKQYIREMVFEYDFTEAELKKMLLQELASVEKEKNDLIKKKRELVKIAEGKAQIGEINEMESWEDVAVANGTKAKQTEELAKAKEQEKEEIEAIKNEEKHKKLTKKEARIKKKLKKIGRKNEE